MGNPRRFRGLAARLPKARAKRSGRRSRIAPEMASLKDISVVVEGALTESRAIRSGEKYVTPQGFTAIKDGQKQRAGAPAAATGRKPAWIRAQLPVGPGFGAVKGIVHEHRLATVCEEAKCPNIGECWNAGTATIMLMGAVCT